MTKFYQIFFICTFSFFAVLSSCSTSEESTSQPPTEVTLQNIAETKPNQITWVGRDQIKSRSRSSSGYGVILNPQSKKLLLYLDQGGACFNGSTCSTNNKNTFLELDFYDRISKFNSLLVNRTSDENQFKDWNFVFVPYSTGDLFIGKNSSVDVPNGGPTNQEMVGFTNLTIILNELKDYFSTNVGIDEIVFAGSSAGGFGVLGNTIQMATILGSDKPTTVIVDAGQLMYDPSILTQCLYNNWNSVWSLDNIFSNSNVFDEDSYVTKSYSYDVQKMYEYLSEKYPTFKFGFLSHYEDFTNRFFYKFGTDNCKYPPTSVISGQQFKDGLLNLKSNVLDDTNWKVFFKNGDNHSFLGNSSFNQTAGGTTLNDWIKDLREGNADHKMD